MTWVHILVQVPLEELNEGQHDTNLEFDLSWRKKGEREYEDGVAEFIVQT